MKKLQRVGQNDAVTLVKIPSAQLKMAGRFRGANLMPSDGHTPEAAIQDGVGSILPAGITAERQHAILSAVANAQTNADAKYGMAGRATHFEEWNDEYIAGLTAQGWATISAGVHNVTIEREFVEFDKLILEVLTTLGLSATGEELVMEFLKKLQGNAGTDDKIVFLTWDRTNMQAVTATLNVFDGPPDRLSLQVIQLVTSYEALDTWFLGLLHYRWKHLELRALHTTLAVNIAPALVGLTPPTKRPGFSLR